MRQVSHISFCVSPVTCHMSLTPTAKATNPPPANSPLCTAHGEVTWFSRKEEEKRTDIATYRLNRPRGWFSENTIIPVFSIQRTMCIGHRFPFHNVLESMGVAEANCLGFIFWSMLFFLFTFLFLLVLIIGHFCHFYHEKQCENSIKTILLKNK